jgi:hypothetical protein
MGAQRRSSRAGPHGGRRPVGIALGLGPARLGRVYS